MEMSETQLGDISSCEDLINDMEKLIKSHLQPSVKLVNACLNLNDQDLAKLFREHKRKTAFMIITRLGSYLFKNIKDLEVSERDHLYNIGLLNIKIITNKYIVGDDKDVFHKALFENPSEPKNITELISQYIQAIKEPSLVRIICLWLDTITYYQRMKVNQEIDDYSLHLNRTIYNYIVQQVYDLQSDLRYCGSFLLYLAYKPLGYLVFDRQPLFRWRRYVIAQMKDLNKWSSDTLHCVMGAVCFITKRFSENFQNYDDEYYLSLIMIITYEIFQQVLLPTLTNDETILIHTITEFFYENVDHNEELKVIFGTLIDQLNNLHQNANHELTKMNVCYLILVAMNETINVSDEILLAYFKYIYKWYEIMADTRIIDKSREKLLQGLKKPCHFDSIKGAMVRLNKVPELLDLIDDHGEITCDILALLSMNSDIQQILQQNYKFIDYIMSPPANLADRESVNILKQSLDWSTINLRKNSTIGLVRELSSYSTEERELYQGAIMDDDISPSTYDIVISCSDTNFLKPAGNHLERRGYSVLILNECEDHTKKEEFISTCTYIVVCLNNDYTPYQSELIIAYKNQVQIVPIIIQIEGEYHPNDAFLEFIIQQYSASLFHINLNDFDHAGDLLINEINRLCPSQERPVSDINLPISSERSYSQTTETIVIAQRLYNACKDNDINTVKEYLESIDIETINQRVFGGSTALHIACYYGNNEIVQLLLNAGASPSIRNIAHGLTPYEEARSQSTKDLFRSKHGDSDQYRFISDDLYIDWISTYREPCKQRDYLQQKLRRLLSSQGKNDDTYGKVVPSMFAYIDTLPLSNQDKEKMKQYFYKLTRTLDPVHIIKAYTSTTGFYKYLNQHIAQNGIDFFDPSIVNINVDYKIVKCVLAIVAIATHDSMFLKFRFCGKTYRGMLMTQEDLYKYVVNSKIMTKSFLSTSKLREIADVFSGNGQDKLLRKTLDKQPIHIAVICTYIIKQYETALDIETISERMSDEKEVLILPFSVFQVKSVKRSSTSATEIELEEIIDSESKIDY